MANTVQYGLQFNTDDMKKLLALAEKLDKQIKSTIDAQASNKAINAAKQETAEITKKTNALKEENKAKAYANKLALENINLDIKRSKTQWKQSGVNSIAGQYGTKYKLTGFKDFDATTLAQKKANIDLLNDKINNQKKIISLQKKFETDMLSISKKYIKASKNMTEEEFRELEDVYYRHYSKIRGYSKENAQRLAQDEIKTLKKQREQAIKPPKPIKPTIFKDPQIALTAFAEKEMVSLKKQSLMMNKKLTKKHLEELETLYKHYYTKIKGLDQKSAADLTKQQLANVKQRQKINSNIANVPMRVGKYIATSTAVYGGLSALRSGMGAIIEYDQALNNVYMAMKNVTEQDKIMLKSITQNSELTAKYGKDYVQLAESLEVLVKAGLKLNEANILLEPSLKLAAAGDMQLDEAARSLTQSLRNLGKPMAYANEMADALATGAAASAVDVKDLITSLEGVGAASKTFGMGAKETVAWIGALGNVGLKGREAANAISRMWLRITKPQAEVRELLSKRGIELFSGTGNEKRLRTFDELMKDIANSSMSLAEKQKLLGVHAFKTGEQIQSAVSSYHNLAYEMERVNGESERMAKQKMEGLQGKIDIMKATWNDIFISQNGISNSMGAAVDKLTGLLKMMADNPQLTKLFAIAGSTGAGIGAGAMIGNVPGAIIGGVAGLGGSAYLLSDMETSVKYTSEEMAIISKESKKAADNLLAWQGRFQENLKDTRKFTLKTLESDLLKSNLRLEERNKKEKELSEIVLKRESEYNALKAKDPGIIKGGINIPAKGGGMTTVKDAYELELKASLQRLKSAEMIRLKESEGNQYLRTRIELIRNEITLREQKGSDITGGKSSKEKQKEFENLDSFLRSLQKLRNSYAEKELSDIEKIQAEINNTYNEKTKELSDKNIKFRDWELAQQEIENDRKIALENAYQKELADIKYKAMEEQNKKTNEQLHDHYQKIFDIYESSLEKYGSVKQRQKLLDEQYLTGFNAIKEEAALRNLSATETEELITNLKREHAEARIQIAYEAWQKENEIANGVLDSVGSAYSTLAQTMTDMDMTGKERREAIWESFRSTAITALMDVLKQQLINFALSKVFSASVTAATAAEAGILATAWTPAAYLASVATLGAAAGIGTAALAGGLASSAALTTGIGLFNNTGGLGGGFPVQDAVVADGKVYPYRKDDLVLAIGTGLGSKSGAQLPDKALPQGSNSSGGNMALINELRNLRLAVVRSDANNVKAIADNTPVFQGSVMDDVAVYKKSLTGKKKSNFIVAVDK